MGSQPQATHRIREEQGEGVGILVRMNTKAIIWMAGRIVQQRHVGQGLIKVRQKISDVYFHNLCDQAEQPLTRGLVGLPKGFGALSQTGGLCRPSIGAVKVTGGAKWIVARDLGVQLVALVLVGRHPLGVG